MSSKPNGSPPPYDNGLHGSRDYVGDIQPQPAYSYYPDDEFLHYYRWSSPPGVIKIVAVIIILLCVAIFACVASTLAWDSQYGMSGFGGMGGYGGGGYGGGGYGAGGYGGGGYGGGGYGGGGYGAGGGGYGGGYGMGNAYGQLGGNYNDPRKGKGFMIAMAAICFIAVMVIFILLVSKQRRSRSRRFYLIVIILSAILAFLMIIATIVYLVAVNPMAQSGGTYGSQIQALCAQYQRPQVSGVFVNQYLYHYCVVEPQEAIAIVFGFLVTAGFIIILAFAVKIRKKIGNHGKENILWEKVKMVDEGPPEGIEEWVNNVSGAPGVGLSEYPEKLAGSRSYLDDNSTDYAKPPYTPEVPAEEVPLQSMPYSSSSEPASSVAKPKKRRARRPRAADGQDYETDYSTADELDDNDFDREFPPIYTEKDRNDYKHEFDRDHQEYKALQAELDSINKDLSSVDRELDGMEEGSPQYLDAMDEYDRLKAIKRSPDYKMKKQRCKYLKAKLNHIKMRVSEFDRS